MNKEDAEKYPPGCEKLHVRIKQAIRNHINTHRPEYLPSERDFQRDLNVSRTTLRKALKELTLENRVVAVHGKGYRVLNCRTTALSGKIGLAVRANSSEYEVMVFNHIIEHVYSIGFQPVMTVVNPRYESASEKLAKLMSEVDGMVAVSSLLALDGVSAALSNAPCRCVAAPYLLSEEHGFTSVAAETFNSYTGLTEFLLDKGHRCIALLIDERDQARYRGVKRAFTKQGIEFIPELIFSCRGYRHCGYERFGEVLASGVECTAVICQNDSCALGVIERCLKERLDVPGRISVVGFDNIPDSARFPAPLTTVGIDLDRLAKTAMDMLFEGIRTGESVSSMTIPTRLLERKSVRQL